MLNRNERAAVDRLDSVLREISKLNPPNPANSRAIAVNLPIATRAAAHLSSAITGIRCGDWDSVEYHLGNAEGIVKPPPEPCPGLQSVPHQQRACLHFTGTATKGQTP